MGELNGSYSSFQIDNERFMRVSIKMRVDHGVAAMLFALVFLLAVG